MLYLARRRILLADCVRRSPLWRAKAEREGFEPSRAFTLLAFQASALGHYATPPCKHYSIFGRYDEGAAAATPSLKKLHS